MRKINIDSIMKKETDEVFHWLYLNRHKFFLVIIVSVIIIFLSYLPYFNLVLRGDVIVPAITLVSVMVFNISVKKIIMIAIVMIAAALPILIIREYNLAELLSDFSYGLLVIGLVKFLLQER